MAFDSNRRRPGAPFLRYRLKHPNLLDRVERVLERDHAECFYYYGERGQADRGTTLRFASGPSGECVVQGLTKTARTTWPAGGLPCHSDHWVSNVFDRKLTLKTLEETLGLSAQVEFDAGVVRIPRAGSLCPKIRRRRASRLRRSRPARR